MTTKKQREQTRIARMNVANELRYSKSRNGKHQLLCEGTLFAEHRCNGRIELNEVIYPRNIFQKLGHEEQMYFWHRINCALNCSFFHGLYGHRRKYRDWHMERVARVYGVVETSEWCGQAPLIADDIVWFTSDQLFRLKEN